MTVTHEVCLKLVVFNGDGGILLARRQNEQLHNGVFTFIGGKMETTDPSLVAAMRREKNEEIGASAQVRILPTFAFPLLYTKPNGVQQILLHYAAFYFGGDVTLGDEYSEWRWFGPDEIMDVRHRVIENVPVIATRVARNALGQRGWVVL